MASDGGTTVADGRDIHHYSELTGEELYVAHRLAALYGSRDAKGRPRSSSKPIRWDTVAVDALEALEEFRQGCHEHSS